MLKIILVFKLVLLVLSEATHVNQSYAEKFQYFILVQSWPQTVCWSLNNDWQNSKCSLCKQRSDIWTLHGLWPNNYNGTYPSNCENEMQLGSGSLNQALIDQLNSKWPTFKLTYTNQLFWNYEWQKHGTCATEVDETNTSEKYFSKSLELLDKYNMGKILKKANIQEGGQYEYSTIFNAINNSLKVNGQIGCVKNPHSGDQYLYEVYICMDKSFNLISCGPKLSVSPCELNRKIIYPKALKYCSHSH